MPEPEEPVLAVPPAGPNGEQPERTATFELIRTKDTGDGLLMEGYAAVFNSPTVIDSWEGNFRETIKPGAFKKTLREKTPVLMFEHGRHPLIGSMPLGTITKAREDDRGVFFQARLSNNWLIQPVRDAIADGAINGMSFRFVPIRDSWQTGRKGTLPDRFLEEISVPELGPVVFPAYTETTVGVRSRELANLLMDPEVRSDLARALFLGNATLDGAALGTPSRAGEDFEPLPVEHSEEPVSNRARAALRRARMRELGVIPHGQDRGDPVAV